MLWPLQALVPPLQRCERDWSCCVKMGAAREPTVSMRVVRALVKAVERTGAPGDELLRAAGIPASQLDATDLRLARSKIFHLCELALELTGDDALGLHWADRLSANSFTPVSHLIAHAMDLRHGLSTLSQFGRLLSDDLCYELRQDTDKLTVHCLLPAGVSLPVQRFVAEMITASFFRIVRAFSRDARAEQVCFAYAAPPYRAEYARVFEHAERFEQPFTGIVFDCVLLNLASPHRDEGVHEALQQLAQRRMLRLRHQAPFALRVQELLVERGPQRVDMQTAARALGLSVRTLRRRLAAEGKSYQRIENDALAVLAKQLLRDKQRTIQETAYEMGFSDATTFHRAFKRWTGTTPSAYRESS